MSNGSHHRSRKLLYMCTYGSIISTCKGSCSIATGRWAVRKSQNGRISWHISSTPSIFQCIYSTTRRTPCEMLFGVPQCGKVIDELTEYLKGKYERTQDLQKIHDEASEAIRHSKEYSAQSRIWANDQPRSMRWLSRWMSTLLLDRIKSLSQNIEGHMW